MKGLENVNVKPPLPHWGGPWKEVVGVGNTKMLFSLQFITFPFYQLRLRCRNCISQMLHWALQEEFSEEYWFRNKYEGVRNTRIRWASQNHIPNQGVVKFKRTGDCVNATVWGFITTCPPCDSLVPLANFPDAKLFGAKHKNTVEYDL